jgi:hypothetical protein
MAVFPDGEPRQAEGRRRVTSRGWLLWLCGFLAVWQPLRFASEVSLSVGTLGMRGPAAFFELIVHGLVTALAVAAGWGLWIGNPAAPAFAEVAVAGSAIVAVQSLYWTRLPMNTMPGDRLPYAIVAIAHAAAWIAYLRRSKRTLRL